MFVPVAELVIAFVNIVLEKLKFEANLGDLKAELGELVNSVKGVYSCFLVLKCCYVSCLVNPFIRI